MPHTQIPSIFSRHWAESALSIFAVIIAAISLWIAIDTERTNRQLVAEAAWPFLQTYHSAFVEGQQAIALYIANAGVGPAKIETLEVFWNGKPYGSSTELLEACCGFGSAAGLPESRGPSEVAHRLHSSYAAGKVLRAGDTVQMISYVFTTSEDAVYKRFGAAREKITYRVCYCSVFNDCWLSDGHDLDPPHVKSCLRPAVPYSE